MIIKILIQNLKFKIYHFNEHIIFIFYIESVLSNNIYTFAKII